MLSMIAKTYINTCGLPRLVPGVMFQSTWNGTRSGIIGSRTANLSPPTTFCEFPQKASPKIW